MSRATRSKPLTLLMAEAQQSLVISDLKQSGDRHVAFRLAQCQAERRPRQPGWPFRCGSAGCHACRRTMLLSWWRRLTHWVGQTSSSFVSIVISGSDVFAFIRRIRKSLRDTRDRAARHKCVWGAVRIGGLVIGNRLFVIVHHEGIPREEVACMFQRQRCWHDPVWSDVQNNFEPSAHLSVEHAANLARRRRGLEPVRIIVFPQRGASVYQERLESEQ